MFMPLVSYVAKRFQAKVEVGPINDKARITSMLKHELARRYPNCASGAGCDK